MGLIHTLLLMQVTWRDGERWIAPSDRSTRVDRMGAWTTGDHHARAQKGGVITATIKSRRGASRSSDQDPTDAILSIFLNAYLRFNRDRPSRSDGHDLIDRFDCLDGYDQKPYI